MKTFLSFLAVLVALLSSVGCVVSQRTQQGQLPPDWAAALPKPGSPAADLAGVFVERGEQLGPRFAADGIVGSVNLSNNITLIGLDENGRPRRPPARSETVELRRIDDTHLELIARTKGEVTARITHEVEVEKNTGALVLRGSFSVARAKVLAAAHASMTARFWRAPDGRLYVHLASHTIGGAVLVPFLLSTEVWSRWDPATPEALERQAAVFAKQSEASEHAREINRLRPRLGEKAPAFDGIDALSGQPVTSADYEGKVVLLHVWSSEAGSSLLNAVRAAYGKHHARGLEVVSLCRNPTNEREKVIAFIKANNLAWPQLHDGQGTHGEIFETYFGTGPARYCVIDRRGNIAALVANTAGLDAAVATALAAP